MKYPPKTMGLFQAGGLILYVCLFASVIQIISQSSFNNVELGPIVGITTFLLTFIVSAIICGSIFLGYPIILFFDGKKNEAYKIVIACLGWLVAFFLSFLIILFLVLANNF